MTHSCQDFPWTVFTLRSLSRAGNISRHSGFDVCQNIPWKVEYQVFHYADSVAFVWSCYLLLV
jgi:hypothetical protein